MRVNKRHACLGVVGFALVSAGIVATGATSPTSHAAQPVDMARLERAIETRAAAGYFMGSVLVARDGKTLLSKGYGKANIADDTPNAPTTKFRLGSITKQFTAASILLLEERGKLKVEDPVRKYMPDAPPAWGSITLFNLLTHTSGIPNYTSFPDYESTKRLTQTPAEVVARFRDKPLKFTPGSAYEYSNSGYVLLGYLIEKVSGQPYAKFVQDNLFAKLGMKDSGYDSSTGKIARRAQGYMQGPGGPVPAPFIDMSVPFSAGALYSTTEDMLRWEQGLFGGKVLKPTSLDKMTTPFKDNYAFGLRVEPGPNGGKIISHTGGIEGFNTRVAYVTADKLTVIVLANLNGPAADEITNDLRKVAENEPGLLPSDRIATAVPVEVLDRLTGHYKLDAGPMLELTRQDDHLRSQTNGQSLDLYPQSATEFFAKTTDMQLAFERDSQGQVRSAAMVARGQKIRMTRLSDAEVEQQSEVLAKKIREQTPTAGSDVAVRETLETAAAGTPEYERLGPALANAVRQQLPAIRPMLQRLGAIKSIEFRGVGPAGADIYHVTCENGALEVRITLDANGKVIGEGLRPLP
jgi:CubicO group peptidase (beta-lactamase class C family)